MTLLPQMLHPQPALVQYGEIGSDFREVVLQGVQNQGDFGIYLQAAQPDEQNPVMWRTNSSSGTFFCENLRHLGLLPAQNLPASTNAWRRTMRSGAFKSSILIVAEPISTRSQLVDIIWRANFGAYFLKKPRHSAAMPMFFDSSAPKFPPPNNYH
jgi:hypothetical protein